MRCANLCYTLGRKVGKHHSALCYTAEKLPSLLVILMERHQLSFLLSPVPALVMIKL